MRKYESFFSNLKCPYCNSSIKSHLEELDIPHFGETILLHLKCEKENCSFKTNDLFSVFSKEPKRFAFRFSSEADLSTKVIKSSSCTIRIPEFGVEIEPSIASEGYFTNIEGILLRITEVLQFTYMSLEHPEKMFNCKDLIRKVAHAIEGNESFTLILEDPMGNSAIISDDENKISIKTLTKEETEKLKVGGSPIFGLEK
ncbi:MAG: ZPR1 zinc finger domain-containing protein [Candidatus Helarchaeota archaeon]